MVDLARFSIIKVVFIFKIDFIFEFAFIIQVTFIFKIVFIFEVVFLFKVVFLFEVFFIIKVNFKYVRISPVTTKICTLFKNCYFVFAAIFSPVKKKLSENLNVYYLGV